MSKSSKEMNSESQRTKFTMGEQDSSGWGETQNPSSSNSSQGNETVAPQSVLVIGATGRVGVETIQQLAALKAAHQQQQQQRQQPPMMIYGMSSEMKSVSKEIMEILCINAESLIQGDATSAADLRRALEISGADTIVVSLGIQNKDHDDVGTRTAAAMALTQVLQHVPSYQHVRVVVVSWAGAAAGKLEGNKKKTAAVAFRRKKGGDFHRRDHLGQEDLFLADPAIQSRTTIVRPVGSGFVMNKVRSTRLQMLGGADKKETVARRDLQSLAQWIADEVVHGTQRGMGPVHVTKSVINNLVVRQQQ